MTCSRCAISESGALALESGGGRRFLGGAAIEYAVGALRVREIVVCRHPGCGAMKALLGGVPGGMPSLGAWLRHAEPSVRRRAGSRPLLRTGKRPAAEADQLALHNVLQQLGHLRQYPVVANAEARGELHLTRMYFDVVAAQVYLFDHVGRPFAAVNEITRKSEV